MEVQEGDVIRFGRIPFKIAKMVLNPNQNLTNNTENNISFCNSEMEGPSVNVNATHID